MTFDLRLGVVALSTFALAAAAGSIVSVVASKRRRTSSPAVYARSLFRLRMLPAALAVAAMVQGILSFMVFEPRAEQEAVGITLTTLAALGVAFYALAIARWARVTAATNRVLRAWMRSATPIELPDVTVPAFAIDVTFPVVAVVGIIKPKLVISRHVLANCSAAEVRAILAHERHHLEHRDNVRRAAMACLPDPLSMTAVGQRLAERWHDAAEQAADDAADQLGPQGRCDLAAALLSVARLVPAGETLAHLPASALYRGEDLERRVRRLIVGDAPPPLSRTTTRQRWLMGVSVLIVGALALHAMHVVVEAAVTYLP